MSPKMIVLSALLVLSFKIPDVESHPKGYVGCFWDRREARAMPHYGGYYRSIAACQKKCQQDHFRYIGMQDYTKCYCGRNYGRYGRSKGCRNRCHEGGGPCGGLDVASVYFAYPEERLRHQPGGYWGCFRDKTKRALKYWAGYVSSIPECIGRCRMNYYQPFAGLQNGRGCYCGRTYGIYGTAKNCNLKCPKGLICGGLSANSVYKVYGVPNKKSSPKGYMGCFRDDARRALPTRVYDVNNARQCIQECYDRKHPYAGLQMGKGCYCGKNYARWGKQTNCNKRCRTGEICGGWSSNSVYKTYAAVNPNPPGGYLGCYRDSTNRSLPVRMGSVDSIRECIERCREKGQPYAGLQAGKGCYCGKNYARYGKQTNCNKRCLTGEYCGGWSSNSVYKV